jgi:hypothetical protein
MLRKETLMDFRTLTFLVILSLSCSCATQKESPDPDMILPVYEPLRNTPFLLFFENGDGSRGKELKEINTDLQGASLLYLPHGKYQLWRPTKKLGLDEFIKAESLDRGKFYSYKDKECFQAWRERADFKFEVWSDSTITLSRPTRCYTDDHPCLKYDGPFRP